MATKQNSQLKVGDEVVSWCTKCLEMKDHIVRALRPDKPARVICTCPEQKERNYRPNPPKSKTSRRKKQPVVEKNPWPELNEKHTASAATRPYTIHQSFFEGEALQHRRYGLGFVIEVLDSTKMVVAFEDKKRTMVCNK